LTNLSFRVSALFSSLRCIDGDVDEQLVPFGFNLADHRFSVDLLASILTLIYAYSVLRGKWLIIPGSKSQREGKSREVW